MSAELQAEGIRRRAVSLLTRQGETLHGVVTEPAAGAARDEVLVFCQAGLQSKAGVGDYFRWLADRLACGGYTVVRFDQSGTGDSTGEIAKDVPLEEYFVMIQSGISLLDTQEMIRWTREAYPGARLYLWAQCGGCLPALMACARDPGHVEALVLMAVPVLFSQPLTTIREHDAEVARKGYLRKLLLPSSYLRLLSGKSEYRLIWASLANLARQGRRRVTRLLDDFRKLPAPDHPLFNHHFWEAFEEVMGQGKPVLFLMAELDNETPDFRNEFESKILIHRPQWSRLCTVEVLAQADHSLMFEEGRLRSEQALLRWLAAQAGSRPELR